MVTQATPTPTPTTPLTAPVYALQATDPREVISLALKEHAAKLPMYRKYNNYYEGVHNLNFATVKWRSTFGSLFRQFADNMCAPVVDVTADRLQVLGFDITENEDAEKELTRIWKLNRMDRKANAIHAHALKTGDAYAIVWPDINNDPIIDPNPAHQVCVYYDDNNGETIAWASKLWQINTGQWRLTIYTPLWIEKWITTSSVQTPPDKPSAFRRYYVPGEMWPLLNPYGRVPVFHFANNPEMGVWGQSELWNVIPLQDALNKAIADMLIAMEFVSLPQRWATGLEVETDPVTNKPKPPFEAGVDRIFANPDAEGRFGQFEAASLDSFTKVQNGFRLDIARITRTPLHYLSMGGSAESAFVSTTYPSGESLKTAEAPFSAKLLNRQTTFGDVWENIMSFAASIRGLSIEPGEIETRWTPATPRSETDDIDNAIKKQQAGIPRKQTWSELGYTDNQVAEFERQAAETQAPAPTTPVQASTVTASQSTQRNGGQNGRRSQNAVRN